MSIEFKPHNRFGVISVLGICLLSGLAGCKSEKAKQAEADQQAYQQRYAKAKALFEERCKTAGAVIKRTVKDVEGIELVKIRPEIPWGGREYFDPMFPGAAMAGEVKGDDYIKQFFMTEYFDPAQPERRGGLGPHTVEKKRTWPAQRKGYAFVEHLDASAAQRYRCTPDWSLDHPNWVPGQHHCVPIQVPGARYALDYEDIVDPADRAHWVAGTKLRVLDKQTGEVIAELTRFVWDPGFGASSTGRWPWQHATTAASTVCPSNASTPLGKDTRYFVDTVLIPKQGDRTAPVSGLAFCPPSIPSQPGVASAAAQSPDGSSVRPCLWAPVSGLAFCPPLIPSQPGVASRQRLSHPTPTAPVMPASRCGQHRGRRRGAGTRRPPPSSSGARRPCAAGLRWPLAHRRAADRLRAMASAGRPAVARATRVVGGRRRGAWGLLADGGTWCGCGELSGLDRGLQRGALLDALAAPPPGPRAASGSPA